MDDILKDCIIVGGGPGGLTAGIYLKRFRRNILLIDNYQSRAELIPKTHNYPGFVNGISGKQLLENLRTQFQRHKGLILKDTVIDIQRSKKEFLVFTEKSRHTSKNIILATGVIDIEPLLSSIEHGIKEGLIRHCPICDAYEVINQKIAVIGNNTKAFQEINFLLSYSSHISLFTLGKKLLLTKQELAQLEMNNISVVTEEIVDADFSKENIIILKTKEKNKYQFDTIYSALGAKVNSNLSHSLGARHTTDDYVYVNKHQQTSISGLYAVGDIVEGLNQICVATSQGAIAATAIHNRLS